MTTSKLGGGATDLPPGSDTSGPEATTTGPDAEPWGEPEIVCTLESSLGDATNPGSLVVLHGFAHIGSVVHGLAPQHWVVDLESGRVVAEPTIGGQLAVVGDSVFVAGWSSPQGANPSVMSLVEYAPEGTLLGTLLEVENAIIHPVRGDGSALYFAVDDLGTAGPLELWSWDFETESGSLVAELDGTWPVLVREGIVWGSYAVDDRTARFGWLSGRPTALVDIVELPGLVLAAASAADSLFVAPSYGSLYRIDPEQRTRVELAALGGADPDVVADSRHVSRTGESSHPPGTRWCASHDRRRDCAELCSPRMTTPYELSARWYDRIYGDKAYRDEADVLRALVQSERPGARTLLEVGCGTGGHLVFLREHLQCAGVDLSASMLAQAREKLPDLPLHEADMRAFDLQERFDVVASLFSAIGYVRSTDELFAAVACMARHLHPGGVLMIEPWFSPEQWKPGRQIHGGVIVDEPELKVVVSEQRDRFAVTPMHHLVATLAGIEHFVETHELLLAGRQEYRAALEAAGLEAIRFVPDVFVRGAWIGRAPA